MISVSHKGNFEKTEKFLKHAKRFQIENLLEKYGELGVQYLSANTPIRTGQTAASWGYLVKSFGDVYTLVWTNSNIQNGMRIAVMLDTGHGTARGGYVRGQNFIKPAIRPIFDKIAEDAWKEVTDA